jgi:hypothetical protein
MVAGTCHFRQVSCDIQKQRTRENPEKNIKTEKVTVWLETRAERAGILREEPLAIDGEVLNSGEPVRASSTAAREENQYPGFYASAVEEHLQPQK